MRLMELEKTKIRTNLEKKKKQVEVDRRVARANHSKQQRMRVMEERGIILDSLRASVQKKLLAIVQDASKYKVLMTDLLRQSSIAIDSDCTVRCCKQDEQMVKSLLQSTCEWFQKTHGKEISITLEAGDLVSEEAWGGVVFTSADGRITCNNTLSARFSHCFVEQMPRIRYALLEEDSKI
eukprot:GILJ01025341.1.p1 GENE.GILJ01025341.1~~GILJ01025341.1.p1  ORF type:complete len:199 (-),score=32.33 GILJ01025341.1:81-620(-)